ncbi:M81 family metallopeptidase [Bordetella sp. 15P40C-2]|uniref:M81 family metallopeptidase n=1 Tax=Bordetella sp. 15P40C-2 TaxID=2572246 RepID=UPI001324F446|nr:M81 family metallopeptidase [Bordetella sp. 15P40C-2]MVW71328.1 microcystin degradation protein MlrC [Bordetella sp. 15P40C-2]
MRIVVGGFQHETNTFAPSKADFRAFELGGGWPGIVRGPAILPALKGANIPAAGFIAAAQALGYTIVPAVWGAASPSAHVTREAFERIMAMMLEDIAAALPVDGVYLDLHGAMVAEHYDDGEGEVLRRVRALIGPDVPLVASLDLHANVTQQMIREADALVAYRTYPHVDMADTGARACAFMGRRLRGMPRPPVAVRQISYLLPTCWQSTMAMPAKGLYERLEALESAPEVSSMSFCMGFPAADFPDCGALVWAYADTQAAADAAADALAADVEAAEAAFAGKLYSPDEAVLRAVELAAGADRPIVIADAQDNPGAGGDSDTTAILRALVRYNVPRSALGLMVDPAAAELVHQAGEGATVRLALGGHSGVPGDAPFEADFVVERLSDGKLTATGPYLLGVRMDLGPSACLRIGEVRVVLSSYKAQMADQAMFRYVGIEPTEQDVLVLKSSTHFRADFTPIAADILICAAPGPMPMDPMELPWTNLREDVHMCPGGPTFAQFKAARAVVGSD